MNLYDTATTRVMVGFACLEEFEVEGDVHQSSVLQLLLFAIAVDVITYM